IGREYALGDRHLAWMQRPCPDAAHQEGVAELRLAGLRVGEVAEWAVERFDARRGAGVDHLGQRVVPEVLLKRRARSALGGRVGESLVLRMPAADTRRLHRTRGGKIGGTEADAVHARRRYRDIGDVVDAFGGLQDGVDQDWLLDRVFCFQLSEELV